MPVVSYIIITIIIQLYFRPQPIQIKKYIQVQHGKIYTIDSQISVVSVKKTRKKYMSPHHNPRHDDVAGVRSQRLILAVNDRLLDNTDVFAGRQEPLRPAWQLIVVLLRYQSRTEHLVADDTPTHGVLRYDVRTAVDRHTVFIHCKIISKIVTY